MHVQVFVRRDAPEDRAAVALVHQLALGSGFVWADAVVAPAFPELARQFTATELQSVVVDGSIRLSGPVTGAPLHGVLIRFRDVGLPLLALTRTDPDDAGSCSTRATSEAVAQK